MTDRPEKLLEICVDSAAGLDAAIKGGADRIELCSALGIGGLTPSFGLMRHAARMSSVPVYALIRPRPGGFLYDPDEIGMMADDIATARDLGLKGVVIGATTEDETLDTKALKRLVDASRGMDITLHRAFDMVKNPMDAIDIAHDLGIARILTSGCAINVERGFEMLERLGACAKGRMSIMPGGGVTQDLVAKLLSIDGICEIHASGSSAIAEDPSLVAFGFATPQRRQTDEAVVRRLKQALLA